MAEGLGFKEFTTGDVLTANDANGYLASQVVMVFADAADRTADLTSPQEGMISYLKDTNAVEKYDGAAWVTIGGSSTPTFVGVSLTGTTTQSIANNTDTAITFPTELIDTDGFHDTVTNTSRITIPAGKGGKYLFNSIYYFDANANGFRFSVFRKNGSNISGFAALPGSSATVVGLTNSIVLDLVATDYVEMFVKQTSGGSLNNSTQFSFFSAIYLGA